MAVCEQCGNDYAHAMRIEKNGETHIFDSFECAIAGLAPRCATCQTPVIGHGLQTDDAVYCCGHCAHAAGAEARA